MEYTGGVWFKVITYGATITSIEVPDSQGRCEDVVLGFDDMSGEWLSHLNKTKLDMWTCVNVEMRFKQTNKQQTCVA